MVERSMAYIGTISDMWSKWLKTLVFGLCVSVMIYGSQKVRAQSDDAVLPKPAVPGESVVTEPKAQIKKEDNVPPAAITEEPQIKSMFFSPDEMSKIHSALAAYEQYKAMHVTDSEHAALDFLNQLQEAPKSEEIAKYYVYPQFFLESLVYHSPKEWVAQINGQKFTPDKIPEQSRLRVINIENDKIRLEWRPPTMERVLARWNKANNENVSVNNRDATVSFTLHPNQTFSSYTMSVLEGKVQPVVMENNADINNKNPGMPNVASPAKTIAPNADIPLSPKPEDKGLSGLIGSYQKLKQD